MWSKLNKISKEKFGKNFSTLQEKQMAMLINLNKANKIAEEEFGEFGFATCKESEMKQIIDTNPNLIKQNNTKMKSSLKEVKQFQKIAGLLNEEITGTKKTIEMDLVPYTGDSSSDQEFWSFLESHNITLSILTWHGPGGGNPVVELTGSEQDLRDLLQSMGHDEDDIAMYMGEE